MSLRNRLWLVLGALFLVPLVVGVLVIALAVPQVKDDQLVQSLESGRAVVSSQLTTTCRMLGLTARAVGLESATSRPDLAVANAVSGGYSDYAALLGPSGNVVAEEGQLPSGSPAPQQLASCTGSDQPLGLVSERVPVSGVSGATTALAVSRLDMTFLDDLRRRTAMPGHILLLDGTRVVASSADAATSRRIAAAIGGRTGRLEIGDWLAQVSPPTDGVPFTVAVTQKAGLKSSTTGLFLLILLAGALVAAALVTVVVRGLSQPLTDLTEAAERVVQGDLDTRIAPSDDSEVGRLSDAFNRMTSELRQNMSALEKSREDLRVSLEQIGDTLMSTHDLDNLLDVVLKTAVVTLQAKAGVVLYGAPEQLHLVADHRMHEAGFAAPAGIAPGVGVLGRVVSSGEAVRGRLGSGPPALEPTETEPAEGNIFAVPLRSMGSVLGVLALYDRVDGRPFDEGDDQALRTLSGQASIAIDNVQLHQEAQRLSTTDALTGLWNFRYLSMSLAREIERSTRFQRPLAVLMLDIDHFKQVNDQHGHARGDAVLRELAQRVQEQIREVDTFARYGGEEFVVVLPETTVEGATQLAERICVAIRRKPFHTEGEESLDVSVSVGGAAFPAHGSSAATLMRAADRALYVAKNGGRDRWHVPDA
ncbi:MAG: diguanylate cyclase [Sporichthyaceae bacterium]